VLGLKRLPLPQDRRLSLMKSLMGTRQHPGRGTGAASGSASDQSRRPKTTSVSFRVGGRMELDVPLASPSMAGVAAVGTSSAAADGVLAFAPTVPLGEITPRWWWRRRDRCWWWLWWRRTRWWWWRRTDAPLCALGLRAGLLGPASSPLMLLGGSETNDPSV
jgi:hypothetical protein